MMTFRFGTRIALLDGRILLAAAASLVALLPVMAAHHLPLLDAPGHEARVAALYDMIVRGRESPFYGVDSFFVPNIAFDTIGLALVPLTGPENAARIFFAVTLLLTLWGVVVLNRVAAGRWSAVPLAAALLLYNQISMLGFLSYGFGVALVFWALAIRLRLEEGRALAGFLAGAVSGVVLLFCHVFAFGIYAVMSTGFAFAACRSGRIGRRGLILRGVEFAPAAVLYGFMLVRTEQGGFAYPSHFVKDKLVGIAGSVSSASLTGDIAFLLGAAAFVVLIAACARSRLAMSFVPGLLVLAVLYLVLPFELASGMSVDQRLPVAIALLLLAGLDVKVRRSTLSAALASAVALALIVKQAAIAHLWRSFDPAIDSAVAAVAEVPRGSVIMFSQCAPGGGLNGLYRERQPHMTHLPALATFDGTRFVAANWAIRGQQPIAVKPAYRGAYELQWSFPWSTCARSALRGQMRSIEALQRITPQRPYYLFLIRPPAPHLLAADARLVAAGRDFELYAAARSFAASSKE